MYQSGTYRDADSACGRQLPGQVGATKAQLIALKQLIRHEGLHIHVELQELLGL
jgi:hypothetical protein